MLRATYAKLMLEQGSLREHLVVAPPCRLAIELDPILFRRPNDAGSELTTTIAVKMCAGQSAVACLFAVALCAPFYHCCELNYCCTVLFHEVGPLSSTVGSFLCQHIVVITTASLWQPMCNDTAFCYLILMPGFWRSVLQLILHLVPHLAAPWMLSGPCCASTPPLACSTQSLV